MLEGTKHSSEGNLLLPTTIQDGLKYDREFCHADMRSLAEILDEAGVLILNQWKMVSDLFGCAARRRYIPTCVDLSGAEIFIDTVHRCSSYPGYDHPSSL